MHNQLAEQTVIGTILMDSSLAKETRLKSEHFFFEQYRLIFESITSLKDSGQEIDVVTLTTELSKKDNLNKVGGVTHLTELATSIPTTANFKHYENLVFEAYRYRKSRELSLKYTENPSDESLAELIKKLENVQNEGVIEEEKNTQDYLLDIAEKMADPPSEIGFKTGFTDFDDMTGGLQKGDLVIIAARPSVGKTAFALNIAAGHCKNEGTSHVFSLEMGTEQLLQRMISSESKINGQKWRTMSFSTDDYNNGIRAIGEVYDWNLNIHEKATNLNEIRSLIRKSVQSSPNEKHLVVIDYLQLIVSTGRYERRDLEVGAITRELKLLAKELDIPIVLLSQLSRGVEQRQDKRPMMSDLRESGNIEQDADVIGFLYRDDYYDSESEKQNIIEIILSKQRNGPTGTVELAFLKEYGKFLSLETRYEGE